MTIICKWQKNNSFIKFNWPLWVALRPVPEYEDERRADYSFHQTPPGWRRTLPLAHQRSHMLGMEWSARGCSWRMEYCSPTVADVYKFITWFPSPILSSQHFNITCQNDRGALNWNKAINFTCTHMWLSLETSEICYTITCTCTMYVHGWK